MSATILREPEQLSLFMPDGINAAYPETVSAKTVLVPVSLAKAPVAVTPKKKENDPKKRLAAILSEPLFKETSRKLTELAAKTDFRALLGMLNMTGFNLGRCVSVWTGGRSVQSYWRSIGEKDCLFTLLNGASSWSNPYPVFHDVERHDRDNYVHEVTLWVFYVSTGTADTVCVPVDIVFVEGPERTQTYKTLSVDSIKVGKPAFPGKVSPNVFFVQTEGEMSQLLKAHKPWITRWLSENTRFTMEKYLAAPWLETLSKAGFQELTNKFLYPEDYNVTTKMYEQFNRLCGPGTSPKDIFKCSKAVYNVLKNEGNLDIWDTLRRLEKKDCITGDTVLMVYQMGLRPKELELVNSILGQKHNGRPVFTFTSLVNYINRLDMYEAICSSEAFVLINDYLHMCHQLGMPPRVDGDSLKREHDIAARLCREKRNQIMEQKMKERAEQEKREIEEGNSKMARATYRENVFFVRPITEYNDLLDEAIQQDNCVASYAERIAEGKTRIFTLRETAHPEKSLVTIELSPDCKTVRQKYLTHNQVIRNKAINDFIDRWHKQLNAA